MPERINDELHDKIGFYGRLLFDAQDERKRRAQRVAKAEANSASPNVMKALNQALAQDVAAEHAIELDLVHWVRLHPMRPWVDRCPGLGLKGFGELLAWTGHLDNFANVAKVWAFFGMHVVNGRAPKMGEARFTVRGRATCRQIGEAIVKLGRGKYWEAYQRARRTYLDRPRFGPSACPFGHTHSAKRARPQSGDQTTRGALQCVKLTEGKETSAHVHAAAVRYAVKELLKDIWLAHQLSLGRPLPPRRTSAPEAVVKTKLQLARTESVVKPRKRLSKVVKPTSRLAVPGVKPKSSLPQNGHVPVTRLTSTDDVARTNGATGLHLNSKGVVSRRPAPEHILKSSRDVARTGLTVKPGMVLSPTKRRLKPKLDVSAPATMLKPTNAVARRKRRPPGC